MKRWMWVVLFLLLCAVAVVAQAQTQSQPIKPGRYVRGGGGAVLNITTASADQNVNFDINVVGANAHLCDVNGTIKAAKAITDTGCQIDFGFRGDVVSVKPKKATAQQCQAHCGMRAWFEGDYTLEPALCGKIKAVKKQFSQDYAAKNYVEAQKSLTNFVQTCGSFVTWRELVPLRNDLAITQFHLNDSAACLATLEPVRSTFIDVAPDDVMRGEPAFREDGVKLVKISQFNWRKCGGTVTVPATQ